VVVTNREGHFKLGGLPQGRVAIEAYVADLGRGRSEDVTVRAGRTTDRVKIALAGGAPAGREPKGAGSLAVTLGERSGVVVVVLVPPGSEAEAAGIEPGDEISAVDGYEVRSIEAARSRLTGPLGEDVVVTLRREEDADDRTIVRVRRERVQR
jgi:S1-C subfamily serine protease